MHVLKGAAIGIGLAIGAVIAVPLITLMVFFWVALPLTTFHVMREWRLPSSSMEPTFHCGGKPLGGCQGSTSDRVISLRYILTSPGRGDIVVFNTPERAASVCGTGGVYVKRIVGLPGEKFAERNGFVYIDGRKLDEPYVKRGYRDTYDVGPFSIPKGDYFVLGDNRAGSCDSRRWGPVPRSNIIGKVVLTYWPPRRIALH